MYSERASITMSRTTTNISKCIRGYVKISVKNISETLQNSSESVAIYSLFGCTMAPFLNMTCACGYIFSTIITQLSVISYLD